MCDLDLLVISAVRSNVCHARDRDRCGAGATGKTVNSGAGRGSECGEQTFRRNSCTSFPLSSHQLELERLNLPFDPSISSHLKWLVH
jgi:hypothetical protein